jgi:hypothetical protein
MFHVLRALVLALVPAFLGAQSLPSEPISVGNGRLVLGAEVTATRASADPGFFNYTDYEYSALRNLRVSISAEARATHWLQFLGELRIDHGERVLPYALYARVTPWRGRRFDVRVGRVPQTFGAFGRGAYGAGNLMIGSPLAYQYLTSLRSDALPATSQDLLTMRGRGWRSNFPLGNTDEGPGLPVVNGMRWDTGLQLHGIIGMIEWTGAVTTGSLSNPRVDDDNDGRQFAGRVVVRPTAGVALGASASRGEYLDRRVADSLPAGRRVEDGVQRAFGVDGEYSFGRFLARGEVIASRWTLPVGLSGPDNERLDATAVLAEARYRIVPGVHLAVRGERLGFGRVQGPNGRQEWDAPVRRLEIGAGWAVLRNVMLKTSWQRNLRRGGRVQHDTLGAFQILYWF